MHRYFNAKHKVPSPWNNQVVDWEGKNGSTSSTTSMSINQKPNSMSSKCREGTLLVRIMFTYETVYFKKYFFSFNTDRFELSINFTRSC